MTIPNVIKLQVFAQYYGQLVALDGSNTHQYVEAAIIDMYEDSNRVDEYILSLEPLSAITDEDAIEVAKIEGLESFNIYRKDDGRKDTSDYVLQIQHRNTWLSIHPNWNLCRRDIAIDEPYTESLPLSIGSYQYLISRGYDLPQYLLAGKTLKEAELAIYE